jgi:hypothetical protein
MRSITRCRVRPLYDTVRELIDTMGSYRLLYPDEALATIEGIMQPHEE